MQVTIRYKRKGEEHEVVTTLGVIVAWERRFKRKASDMANGFGIEDLAFLAYEASKLHKIVVPAVFDQFINELEHIEIVTEEPANPTHAAPSEDH
jgi:hypothetical protein